MSRKKKENAAQSTRQLMGIDGIKDYCIATRMGDLVFFIIKPTNISVLSDSSISARIYALLNVVKGQAEIEMLALNSKESFERNKTFYQERQTCEELPPAAAHPRRYEPAGPWGTAGHRDRGALRLFQPQLLFQAVPRRNGVHPARLPRQNAGRVRRRRKVFHHLGKNGGKRSRAIKKAHKPKKLLQAR